MPPPRHERSMAPAGKRLRPRSTFAVLSLDKSPRTLSRGDRAASPIIAFIRGLGGRGQSVQVRWPRYGPPKEKPLPSCGVQEFQKEESVISASAIDVKCLTCDEAAVVTDQEQACRGDLVHLPLSPQRNADGALHPPL